MPVVSPLPSDFAGGSGLPLKKTQIECCLFVIQQDFGLEFGLEIVPEPVVEAAQGDVASREFLLGMCLWCASQGS